MKNFEFSKEHKEDAMRSIKEFFLKERDEELSDFRANIFLDFIIHQIGPCIYNQAIADAYALMATKVDELYGLEKRITLNTPSTSESAFRERMTAK